MASPIALPQWIEMMYPGKVGRDHLGLGSVSSDQILPDLSPGINVLTHHPRYHSFYTFLLDEFWLWEDRPKTRRSWVAFFRPREFIFSLGAHLGAHATDKPEHEGTGKIVGSTDTEPRAREGLDSYFSGEDYIKSELGGYGLYYRSVMAELELIYPGGQGFPSPVDVPSEKGRELAQAFRQAVQDTEYYRKYLKHDEIRVPSSVIREYINNACHCQLNKERSPDRRPLLDVFLHGGEEGRAKARRETLRFLLDLAAQTDGCPIDQDSYRQLLYFQSSEKGATYTPSSTVTSTYLRWRLFQLREYFNLALSAIWRHLCDWGVSKNGDIHPLPVAVWWDYVRESLDFGALASALGAPAPTLSAKSPFHELLEWLTLIAGPQPMRLTEPFELTATIQEHKLYHFAMHNQSKPTAMLTGMITLLALLYHRFNNPAFQREPEWRIARMGANGRLPLDGIWERGFIPHLKERIRDGDRIIDVARWLIADYVMLQHQLTASRKLPENTYRFQREGDSLRFYPRENPIGFQDSRFEALSTTIYELGLCGNLSRPHHPLTEDGRRLLELGDLP